MKPKVAAAIITENDGEPIEAIGQVHGVAGADDDEGAEEDIEPAEIDERALEEGNGERGRKRLLTRMHDRGGGGHGGEGFDHDLNASAKTFRRLLGDFQVVVVEADGAVDQCEQQHDRRTYSPDCPTTARRQ